MSLLSQEAFECLTAFANCFHATEDEKDTAITKADRSHAAALAKIEAQAARIEELELEDRESEVAIFTALKRVKELEMVTYSSTPREGIHTLEDQSSAQSIRKQAWKEYQSRCKTASPTLDYTEEQQKCFMTGMCVMWRLIGLDKAPLFTYGPDSKPREL